MSKPREKPVVMTTWVVPVRYTLEGVIVVVAASADEALAKVGEEDLEPGAALVDWEARDKPREAA